MINFFQHTYSYLIIQSDHFEFAGDENVCELHAVWDDGIPATFHANVNLTSTHKSRDINNPQLPHHTDADALIYNINTNIFSNHLERMVLQHPRSLSAVKYEFYKHPLPINGYKYIFLDPVSHLSMGPSVVA